MAERLKIDPTSATVFGGPAYEFTDEDGPSARFDYYVGLTAGGQDYVHPTAFRQRYDAQRLLDRVTTAGEIDPAAWSHQEPRMPLEERLSLYAAREDEVRHGLRPEWDMYHGID